MPIPKTISIITPCFNEEASVTSRAAHGWWIAIMLGITLAWFGPVLFVGKIFISDNYVGAFYIPLRWWSDLLFSGSPLYGDLNFGNAYPVRMAFSGIADLVGQAHSYNFFVWSAFAIGAAGTYLYVFELTSDAAAAAIAGSVP